MRGCDNCGEPYDVYVCDNHDCSAKELEAAKVTISNLEKEIELLKEEIHRLRSRTTEDK